MLKQFFLCSDRVVQGLQFRVQPAEIFPMRRFPACSGIGQGGEFRGKRFDLPGEPGKFVVAILQFRVQRFQLTATNVVLFL